jgi:hypothetical protein
MRCKHSFYFSSLASSIDDICRLWQKCSNQFPVVYKEVACGGNALGLYAAVRLRTSRREQLPWIWNLGYGFFNWSYSGGWVWVLDQRFLVDKATAEYFLHENATVADEICNITRSQFFERWQSNATWPHWSFSTVLSVASKYKNWEGKHTAQLGVTILLCVLWRKCS